MNALLIAAQTKDDFYDLSYQLDELRALVETIDIKVAYTLTQKVDKINPATYIGIGKLQEAKNICLAYDIDVCIFNDELSPSQMRNVKDIINCDVYDRSYVVLKIFELRAQTKEAKLEVKLAKDYYLLPRTDQFKTERVSGASNVTRGKGESESELDKRRISNEIVQIKKQIAEINKMQETQIINRKKNDIPIVALVGYTNAGKSSTMNTILNYCEQSEDKHVDVKDQLFMTLETYSRKVSYKKQDFILVDTVGLVSKLPYSLMSSFYSTFRQIKNADLIIHVLDASSPYINEQANVVVSTLYQVDAMTIPQFFLLNKWDNVLSQKIIIPKTNSLPFSNKTGLNVETLLDLIVNEIAPSTVSVKLLIPYNRGDLFNILEQKGKIEIKDYREDGVYYEGEIEKKYYDKVKEFDLEMMVS